MWATVRTMNATERPPGRPPDQLPLNGHVPACLTIDQAAAELTEPRTPAVESRKLA